MAENNTSNIGFEKQIWDAACVLRGNIDASEYKSVVLGLIFLKYISDRFEAKYKELVEEGDGFEEDQDEYTAENIFFVPENARWSAIAAAAHTPEIGTVIDDAMRSIEKENKRLKDILPKNFARPELDKRRLGEVVDLFTNIQMIEHGSSKDILGRTYEYCLSKFAEQEGKLAGEFYTPSCVMRTLVEVLQPFNGRVYDPCCGSGGMFVQSAKFIENHGGNINKISVFGQDSNPTTWKMAQMNLAIRGIEADLGKFNADTFFNDCHPQLKADFIMANPPFNLSGWGADKLVDDVRWQEAAREEERLQQEAQKIQTEKERLLSLDDKGLMVELILAVRGLYSQIEYIQGQQDSLSERVDNIESDISSIRSDISDLESRLGSSDQ